MKKHTLAAIVLCSILAVSCHPEEGCIDCEILVCDYGFCNVLDIESI